MSVAKEAAQAQVMHASRGTPLARIDAIGHHPEMTQVAKNNLEARYKAAYWQAVGSRMLQSRGQPSSTLTAAALADLAAGQSTDNWFGALMPQSLFYRPTSTDQVVSTITNAIARLQAAGAFDAAGALSQTLDQRASRRQLEQAAHQSGNPGSALVAALDPRPQWMKTRGFTYALYGFGAIITLGLIASLFRWAFSPYIGAGRAAYRTVRGRR